jgi:hypothetical protein
MVNLGSLPGAACCHRTELPADEAAPLQALAMQRRGGYWEDEDEAPDLLRLGCGRLKRSRFLDHWGLFPD